jgi:hypothetical protein
MSEFLAEIRRKNEENILGESRRKIEEKYFKIVEEVISSDYFKGWTEDLLKNIRDRVKTSLGREYGFGEGCYYKDKVDATADFVYQIVSDNLEAKDIAEMPETLDYVLSEIKRKIDYILMLIDDKRIVDIYEGKGDFIGEDQFIEILGVLAEDLNKFIREKRIDGITRYGKSCEGEVNGS